MTVAQLGFAIDSSQAAEAASDLDKLTSSAARAEQAAQKTGSAGTRMSRGFADLNPALEKIIGSLGRLEGITTSIDKKLDAMTSAAGRAARANQVLDKSAIEASTAYKQLEASLNAVTAAQKKTDSAQAGSLAMIEKQKAAIASLNVELAKLRNTPMPSQPNPNVPRRPPANSNFQTGNIAAQLFDIGSTAGFMSPTTVGLQQGPQLAQAFAGQSGKQALAGLASGLAAIASPVSLAAIGLTTAAAAAIQFGVGLAGAEDHTKKLDDALERHDGLLKRLENRYGSLIEKARGYDAESGKILNFESGSDQRALRLATKTASDDFFSSVGTQTRGGYMADAGIFTEKFRPFNAAITQLRNEFKDGRPDFEAFYDSLYKTSLLKPDYAKRADELAKLVEQFRHGAEAAAELDRIQRQLFNDIGPNGMLLSQGPTNQGDMGNLALYESQRRVAAQRQRQGFDAQMLGVNARSPQERAAAARAAAASQYNGDETGTERRVRIEQAGTLALAQAERQLADAQRDRSVNLDKILKDQQQEIDLVGKTGGAAAALRKEYELTSALRMEAARQGIDVDQKELDLIHERAQALGELTDKYNQSRFNFEMGQQAADARLSPRDRQITTTLRQYGLPEDLKGANAQRIGQQIDWQDAKDMAKGFGSAFGNELVSGSHDLGKALLKGLQSTLENEASKLWEKFFDGVGNMFADWLTGSKGSGASSGGAIGSVISAITGKSANDNSAGGFSGLAKVIPVTKSALPDIGSAGSALGFVGNYKSGVDPRLTDILQTASAKFPGYKVDAFSGLRPGDPRFHGKGLATDVQLTDLASGAKLGNYQNASSFRQYEQFAQTARQVQMDKYPELSDSFRWGGYFGGPKGKYGAVDQMHFDLGGAGMAGGSWKGGLTSAQAAMFPGAQSQGMGSATDAVNKLAAASKDATVNLSGFGNGLGKVGQSLSTSFFPSAPSAPSGGGSGGLFSWIGGLFGGGGGANLSKYKGLTGLFADGTNYAPGGMAIVGERGPELVNLPQGSQVFNSNKSAQMMGEAANQNGSTGRPQLHVHVHGGSGDEHIRELSRQGAQEAIYQFNQGQVRGAVLDNQQKATARKG